MYKRQVYIVGRDDKKIKKAYQTLMKLNNIIEKKDLLHNDFLDCKLKYQKVLLADLEAKYTKKNISQSRRKKIVETSYTVSYTHLCNECNRASFPSFLKI